MKNCQEIHMQAAERGAFVHTKGVQYFSAQIFVFAAHIIIRCIV